MDAVLNYYLSEYKNGKVEVIGKVKEPPDISNVDFCNIISNLIKNAIEDIERENHGLGLVSVRETVKKNGGTFELTGDGKEVTARVILKVK